MYGFLTILFSQIQIHKIRARDDVITVRIGALSAQQVQPEVSEQLFSIRLTSANAVITGIVITDHSQLTASDLS